MRAMTLASALTLAAAAALMGTIVKWSADRSDEIAKTRQLQMVESAIARKTAQVPHDQESVAIWDDSVVNVRNAFNENWIDVNLGVWMSTYFKHDRSYVLDAKDRLLYGMADGKETDVKNTELPNEVMTLVRDLRGKIASGGLDVYEKGDGPLPRAVDRIFVEGHPAIVSVMPLVPHSSKVSQERGTECVIVGLRFLDKTFPADLAANFRLDGARFSRDDDVKPAEMAYTVTNNANAPIGKFIWTPDLPGRAVLHDVVPVLAAGLAAIALAMIWVLWRLRNAFQELMASEARSRHLAYHDALTGLPNRAFFAEELKTALKHVEERKGSLAILFLDLDRFKQVNDTLGHAVGDKLICHLAKSFSDALSPGDLIARMGGDEFAILKQVSATPEELNATCESLLQVASDSFEALGRKAMIGLSIGVAIAPNDGIDQSELLRKADIALYQAKVKGGQRYQLFTEDMGKRLFARQEMETELRCALHKDGELELFYQPIYSAKDMEIYGVEALVRWNHPRLGLVPPLDFIGIAEESGLIDRLGEWVLREACRAARRWNIETLSVNVSALQLAQPRFAESVLDILLEMGFSPHKLELEITETALLDGCNVGGKKALRSLREAGIRIALDDFGTGYSSLNYLIALEVDRVKIDRSFVEASASRSIIWAIINMAHALGLTVTAEGIETEDQKDFLVAIGSNHLQGFYLSKPLPEGKVTELIEAGSSIFAGASTLSMARG
jgi:diguanylate cyclase (GGDEF)-like protein